MLFILICLFSSLVAEAASPRTLEMIRAEHLELQEKATFSLQKMGEQLEVLQAPELAARMFKLAKPAKLSMNRVVSLQKEMQPELDPDLPREVYAILKIQREFSQTHANRLYVLARRASKIGYPAYAYGIIQEVLRFDPDHQVSRKIMGYERYDSQWLTPFEKRMAKNNFIEHDQFGWVKEAHVARYEAGERFYDNRWISAAREQEMRRDLSNAWTIESEHFVIKTNHSHERGVDISRKLENFHRFFYQTFHSFFTTPQQMEQLFDNSSRNLSRSLGERHQVFFFNSKDEYVAHLARKIPGMIINEAGQRVPKISITNGLYLTADQISYFYHDPNARDDSVLYHEATHQIFFESAPRRRQVAEKEHFWLMEGIACYMESFELQDDDTWTVGNILHDRFYASRVRLLEDNHYIPLQQFCGMSLYQFQGHPRLAWNYSQASGLTHFLMHYEDGLYRDALIEHLVQIYNAAGARPRPVANLSQLTQTSYEELDRQYAEYIKVQSIEEKELLKELQFNPQIKDLN
ncbi:DUF1570 domain-containing protein [Polystyrenella longa]|nr:DUF1570 domain-containing protein [Polystyrenella longa]